MADFDPKDERWLQRYMPFKIMEPSSEYVSHLCYILLFFYECSNQVSVFQF